MREVTSGVLVALPWSWQGPTHMRDAEGNEWWEIRVAELEDFYVAAPTHEQAIAEAGPALEAFLDSFENREEMPLPKRIASFKEAQQILQTTGVRELQVA
jgi:hypothetical protein